MRFQKRFRFIIPSICLVLVATLLDLACGSRRTPGAAPVEEAANHEQGATIDAPPGVVFAPPQQDQTSTIRFERITAADGLSQNAVLAIWQDQRGFMWFGTEGGLNKYDGYQFTVYKHDPDDPLTLSDARPRRADVPGPGAGCACAPVAVGFGSAPCRWSPPTGRGRWSPEPPMGSARHAPAFQVPPLSQPAHAPSAWQHISSG